MNVLQRRALIRWAIGLAVGVSVWLITTGFRTAWQSKESATDHAADVKAIRADLQRILDVVCEGKPSARRCHQPDPQDKP